MSFDDLLKKDSFSVHEVESVAFEIRPVNEDEKEAGYRKSLNMVEKAKRNGLIRWNQQRRLFERLIP